MTETPLFPSAAAGRPPDRDPNAIWEGPVPDRRRGETQAPQILLPDFNAPDFTAGRGIAHGLRALPESVRRFQRAKGLDPDGRVNPGGPTERALDAQNERARAARLDRLEAVSREIMESDAPEYAPIGDRAAADAMAGLIVANEVQERRREKLAEKPDEARAANSLRKAGRQRKGPGSSERPENKKSEIDNADEKHIDGLSFDFSDIPPVLEKFDDSHIELLQQNDYWKNRATLVEIHAELDGKADLAGFVAKTIADRALAYRPIILPDESQR